MVSDLSGKGTAMAEACRGGRGAAAVTKMSSSSDSKGGSDVKERQPTAVKVEEQRPAAVKVKEQGSGGSNLRSGVFD
ncbi:hypothetical protein WN944_015758 [Citrus x changshan-huyou]|uniref:Uncharacterized protein n=1 Tax=Citrus x changshan-huyou TaxID=2935761 RepID=A0AAP0MD27_9ROSI